MVSTTAWLLLVVVVLAGAFVVSAHTAWLRTGDRVNTWMLRLLADVRTPWLSPVNGVVGFVPRARLVAYVRNTEDLALCGRGATCPG